MDRLRKGPIVALCSPTRAGDRAVREASILACAGGRPLLVIAFAGIDRDPSSGSRVAAQWRSLLWMSAEADLARVRRAAVDGAAVGLVVVTGTSLTEAVVQTAQGAGSPMVVIPGGRLWHVLLRRRLGRRLDVPVLSPPLVLPRCAS